jgi:hypothetical protein
MEVLGSQDTNGKKSRRVLALLERNGHNLQPRSIVVARGKAGLDRLPLLSMCQRSTSSSPRQPVGHPLDFDLKDYLLDILIVSSLRPFLVLRSFIRLRCTLTLDGSARLLPLALSVTHHQND